MEEKEERRIQIAGLVLSIISILVSSAFIMFFIGVAKVDAYTSATSQIWTNNEACLSSRWSGKGTMYCINNTTHDYRVDTRLELNMTANAKYTMYYSAKFIVHFLNDNGVSNYSVTTQYRRNNTTGDINSCQENYSSTISYDSNGKKIKTFNVTVKCVDVQFSSATDAIIVYSKVLNNQNLISPGLEVKITQLYLEKSENDDTEITDSINNGTNAIINSQENNTNNIINGIEQGTEDIIDNQNQNTQDIIDNQNANSQAEIESEKVCRNIDKNSISKSGYYLNLNGDEIANVNYGITDYIKIEKGTIEVINQYTFNYDYFGLCFYNESKNKISCQSIKNLTGQITIPNNAIYFRSTIYNGNLPTYKVCTNGNQAIGNLLQDVMEMNDWEHQTPDSGDLDDVEDLEEDIGEYLTDPVDMDDLDYEIDTTTNETIWQIFDDIVTGNATYLTTFLSILFCGIIKLILAR